MEDFEKKLDRNRQDKVIERLAFEERLNKAFGLSEDQNLSKVLSEDQTPHTGIWYYLWLKPTWKLWTYPYINRAPGHFEVWPILVELIATHYNLKPNETSILKEQYRCFPRGRIDKGDLKNPDKYFICHGDDFPIDKNGEIYKIISIFNLTIPQLHGLVEIVCDAHEKTDPKHINIAKMLIGEY
jgi:hypothetical protein